MGPQAGVTAQAHLLEVDVGTDQHVIEQEDPALLGLDQLPTVAVDGLCQRLTEEQLPLARGQQLEEKDRARSTPTSPQAVTQTSPCQRARIFQLLGDQGWQRRDKAGPLPPPPGRWEVLGGPHTCWAP